MFCFPTSLLVDSAKSWFSIGGSNQTTVEAASTSAASSTADSAYTWTGSLKSGYTKDAAGNIIKKPAVQGAATFAQYVKLSLIHI